VIAPAATATKDEEARFRADAVRLLARLNDTGMPIGRVPAQGTVTE
jgi:hypothetical protein